MPPGVSVRQQVRCTVMDGGTLEYYPGLTIPFPQAAFTQTVAVSVGSAAKFGMLATWAMGRVERGEYLAFRQLSSRTTVALDGGPCYCDAIELSPECGASGWGVLEGH